jgi:hypothetical protein
MSRGGFRTAEFYQLVSFYYIVKKWEWWNKTKPVIS